MEKKNSAKTVEMNAGDKREERKRLTYEQLNDACIQLSQQNRQLLARNQELESFAVNKRLDYLFKVLQYKEMFNSDFVIACSDEVQSSLVIPKDLDEDKEE